MIEQLALWVEPDSCNEESTAHIPADGLIHITKDSACTENTPVVHGVENEPIYNKGIKIRPKYPGKQNTAYEKKIHLAELLPLEDYNKIIVLFSGGKDSSGAYYKLRELGVPKSKIQLWHHDLDGGHPERKMDWPATLPYVEAFAEAEDVELCTSWRVNGFFGEVYRIGASYPIEYKISNGEVHTCKLSAKQEESQRIRWQLLSETDPGLKHDCLGIKDLKLLPQDDSKTYEELSKYGKRLKFPAKTGDLNRRWCSAYLKIDVASAVIRHLESLGKVLKFPAKGSMQNGRFCSPTLKAQVSDSVIRNLRATKEDTKILIVSGERRGESPGRSRYNEMEIHRTNATAKAHRLVHQWRPVIDHSLRDIWEINRRHGLMPHPCYICGWNRCSCKMCIFSLPTHWAGIRELFPDEFDALCEDERNLKFTIDNKKTLEEYVSNAKSCVCHDNPQAIHQLVTGDITVADIYPNTIWQFPAGAFKGSEGGPC